MKNINKNINFGFGRILNLTVSHFDKLSLEQILKIREDYSDVLRKFRKEVDRINELVNQQTEDQEEKIQSRFKLYHIFLL